MCVCSLQARLRDRHQALLRKKLFSLKQQVSPISREPTTVHTYMYDIQHMLMHPHLSTPPQQLSEVSEESGSAPLFPSAAEEEVKEEEDEEVSVKQEEEEEQPGPSGAAAEEE